MKRFLLLSVVVLCASLLWASQDRQEKSSGISIYVKADTAPVMYSWLQTSSGDWVYPLGDWPGSYITQKATINRISYYVYTFDPAYSSVNIILNTGSSGFGSQTGDFVNITQDAFFIYDGGGLAYGLIPPTVYGNPTGEYAFYVNTEDWEQVYAVVDGVSYPMTLLGRDGAGFEVYKWEQEITDIPYRITFNDGNGNEVVDAAGTIYEDDYVKGGYYLYTFFGAKMYAGLDRVATIIYEAEDQVPVLENCQIQLISDDSTWNSYADIEFKISGTYFNQSARKGSVFCKVDNGEYMEFTGMLNSEDTFEENVTLSFDPNADVHTITLTAKDESGVYSQVVTVLDAIDVRLLSCNNLQDYTFTGEAITFEPDIYYGNYLLEADVNYYATFLNNDEPGIATLHIEGKPLEFIGVTDFYFNINAGIDEFTEGVQITGTRYFDLTGRELSSAPATGFYLQQAAYSNGTTNVKKVIK